MSPKWSRRELLVGGSVALGGLLGPVAWQRLATGTPAAPATFDQFTGRPANLSTPIDLFDRLITPTRHFFIRSHFGPPRLDPARPLRIAGLVDRPLTLRPQELATLPEVTLTAVLQCAGNGRALHRPRVPGVQWVHGAMGQATWTGVRLRDLLERAGVRPGALHLKLTGADAPSGPKVPAFVRSIPLDRGLDPTTLVAWRMNGEPLTLAHGAPLRLVVPGWAGDHWMKWLTEVSVEREEADGFYMRVGYKIPNGPVTPGSVVPPDKMIPLTVMPVRSLIARPADGGRARPGPQEVLGIAFSGDAEIDRVEVATDGPDGEAGWRVAELEGEPGPGRWQLFRLRFEASRPGRYQAIARATDRKGRRQPQNAAWNPSGYFWNAWHRVGWRVA